MIAITPLYSIAVILSFVACQFTTVVFFGQSGGLYDHYFDTFLNPIDLLWSFLQALLMAITILLIHTYYGYFATGGPSGRRCRGGQRGTHFTDRRRLGDAAGLTVRLRLQRQLQPVGIGERQMNIVRAPAGGSGHDRRARRDFRAWQSACSVAASPKPFRSPSISERAGLVMNPDAKVKMRGVQVGQVASIETRPDGTAVLHLAMDPISSCSLIPCNVLVDITSSTVFGAKFVELVPPDDPSADSRCARVR